MLEKILARLKTIEKKIVKSGFVGTGQEDEEEELDPRVEEDLWEEAYEMAWEGVLEEVENGLREIERKSENKTIKYTFSGRYNLSFERGGNMGVPKEDLGYNFDEIAQIVENWLLENEDKLIKLRLEYDISGAEISEIIDGLYGVIEYQLPGEIYDTPRAVGFSFVEFPYPAGWRYTPVKASIDTSDVVSAIFEEYIIEESEGLEDALWDILNPLVSELNDKIGGDAEWFLDELRKLFDKVYKLFNEWAEEIFEERKKEFLEKKT